MGLTLADGISFCIPGSRTIFLDLLRDRYVALTPDADQSFRRLASGETLARRDHETLKELVAGGLLTQSPCAHLPRPCHAPLPDRSVFQTKRSSGATTLFPALWNITRAQVITACRPLNRTLDRLRERKWSVDFDEDPSIERLEQIAATFASCSMMASALDQCLPRSIAVAYSMISRSLCPELVIGVRLQPFSAHCWVQHRGTLINDVLDRVRNYTPIHIV